MKLVINEVADTKEIEITINCPAMDERLRHLANYIRQYSYFLQGTIDDSRYSVPLDNVIYIDSVDKSTFFYDKHKVYRHKSSLSDLAAQLEDAMFVRVSKNCIINLAHLHSIKTHELQRLEITMNSGERIIVGRAYVKAFKQRGFK